MPFEIIRADITQLEVDAIVNAANPSLLGGGGVDGAIHSAAGPELLEVCKTLGGCRVGEAKITPGFHLKAKHVIHTVGPVWKDGMQGEDKALRACYENSLNLALNHKLKSVAFPLISTGAFGYPKHLAFREAFSVISAFIMAYDITVYLVVYDHEAFALSEKLFNQIKSYIDDHYVFEHWNMRGLRREVAEESRLYNVEYAKYCEIAPSASRSLDDVLELIEATFSEHLMKLIDAKGKTDVEVYKKANMDRRLFSKIRSDAHYRPSKSTVLALAIALELSLDETVDLLKKAGFALSRSSHFDIIIEFFIEQADYDIFKINEALFAFNQEALGV